MAQGGVLISEAFEITTETQVKLQVQCRCQKSLEGNIELILKNTTNGSFQRVCIVDVNSINPTTASVGFSMRLPVGSYEWESYFETNLPNSNVYQEGTIEIQNALFGAYIIPLRISASRNGYFYFSGADNMNVDIDIRADRANELEGQLRIEDLNTGRFIDSPKIKTIFANNRGIYTDIYNFVTLSNHLYKASFITINNTIETFIYMSLN